MTDIVIKWLVPFILTAIVGFLAKTKTDDKAMKKSMIAMLRSQIVSKCEQYLEKEYLPDYARFCLSDLFDNYTKLGGNHGVKALVDQVFKLPAIQNQYGRRKDDRNKGE